MIIQNTFAIETRRFDYTKLIKFNQTIIFICQRHELILTEQTNTKNKMAEIMKIPATFKLVVKNLQQPHFQKGSRQLIRFSCRLAIVAFTTWIGESVLCFENMILNILPCRFG